MGSHFLKFYKGTAESHSKIVGCGDEALTTRILHQAKVTEIKLKPKQWNSEKAVSAIVMDEYFDDTDDEGEHPQGAALIQGFATICHYFDPEPTIHEVYVDDEKTPELWSLLIDGDDDLPFEIPNDSKSATTYYYVSPNRLKEQIKVFTDLLNSKEYDKECLSEKELNSIIADFKKAAEQKKGLFIFWTV